MRAAGAAPALVQVHGLEPRQLLSATMVAHPLDTAIAAGSATPGSNWYTPAELSAAYGVSGISFGSVAGNGAGQTIAIITAFDNPDLVDSTDPAFDASDLHMFDAQFGLPDPPSFTKVGENGGSTAGLTPDSYWANESGVGRGMGPRHGPGRQHPARRVQQCQPG